MNKKVMISQPMRGISVEGIALIRSRAITHLIAQGYDIVNTLRPDDWYNREELLARGVKSIPLNFLAESLGDMSRCDTVYFCKGWEYSRGCQIEHAAAVAYGLEILYG